MSLSRAALLRARAAAGPRGHVLREKGAFAPFCLVRSHKASRRRVRARFTVRKKTGLLHLDENVESKHKILIKTCLHRKIVWDASTFFVCFDI